MIIYSCVHAYSDHGNRRDIASTLQINTACFFRILFPGGGVDLSNSGYGNVGETVFNLAIQVQ